MPLQIKVFVGNNAAGVEAQVNNWLKEMDGRSVRPSKIETTAVANEAPTPGHSAAWFYFVTVQYDAPDE